MRAASSRGLAFGLFKTNGPQMHVGSDSAPTFTPGTYTPTSGLARSRGEVCTLTIVPVP